ncbi:MAG TPA: prolipoprotein diacylglyceryl transferase [Streptosporangiaceae bacterium]|jgi:prolipoprotein diacylglyceryl transferase
MHIPSPSVSGFHIGPVEIHVYALMYLIGIALAIWITRRRWQARGGNPDLVADVAIWAVPAGIIGGRIYFDITTPMDIPHVWYGVFAVWDGGLGIWGGIALAAVVGAWRVRRAGGSVAVFMDAVAPALLVAQAVGRIGNYFNKELFGKPTGLPWGLEIPLAYRPPGYTQYATFQPSFLYELIADLLVAALLVWLGHHRKIKPPGLFALYVAGYSGYRIFEETIRIDSSEHILGMRLNFWIALLLMLAGLAWFARSQVSTRHSWDEPAYPGMPEGDTDGAAAIDGAEPSGALPDGAELSGEEPDGQDEPAGAEAALREGATPRGPE